MKETYQGIEYDCNETYSNKDHTGHDLSDRTDMSNIVIHGLCLSNETPNAQVLPPDLTGTTFLLCNLDNVFIPDGNTLIDCSNRLFQVQDDGQDWEVEVPLTKVTSGLHSLEGSLQSVPTAAFTPLQPLNLAEAIEKGINTDPAQITAVAVEGAVSL